MSTSSLSVDAFTTLSVCDVVTDDDDFLSTVFTDTFLPPTGALIGLDLACCSCSCFFLAATKLLGVAGVVVGVDGCPGRFKPLLFARMLPSSAGCTSTFLSTEARVATSFSSSSSTTSDTFLIGFDCGATEVLDVFAADDGDDDDGFRDASTLDDVFLVVDVDVGVGVDSVAVPVDFVSVLGSAFRADFALATIPELCDFTCKAKMKKET